MVVERLLEEWREKGVSLLVIRTDFAQSAFEIAQEIFELCNIDRNQANHSASLYRHPLRQESHSETWE